MKLSQKKRHDPEFDRRDVNIITQNALADATYLMYIRAHYNRSTQQDPPFFAGLVNQILARPGHGQFEQLGVKDRMLGLLKYPARPLDWLFGEKIGKAIERDRRAGTSFFKPEKPPDSIKGRSIN